MTWHINQFREAVKTGRANQLRAEQGNLKIAAGYTATAGLIDYQVYGAGDKRNNPLLRPDFARRRLWVAQSLGAVLHGRHLTMTVVSTDRDDESLYRHLAFSDTPDGQPLVSYRQDLHAPEQAVLWAKKPGSHQHFLESVDIPLRAQPLVKALPPAAETSA